MTPEQIVAEANECPACDAYGICPSHRRLHREALSQRLRDTVPGPIIAPDDPEFPDWCEGYYAARHLVGEHWLILQPLLPCAPDYHPRSRVTIANAGGTGEHWCYPDHLGAALAFVCWPAPPTGWSRHLRWDDEFEWPDR